MTDTSTVDLSQLLPTAIGWGNVLIAVITLVVGWALSRLARRGVLAVARRARGLSENVTVGAARVAGYTVLLLAFGIALAFLGANVQPVLAVVVTIGVVLVLVMRGISDNFTSGVVIQARQTVKLGDEIQIDGPNGPLTGIVFEVNARSVLMRTADGREVHVPNARLLANVLVNHTSHGARRSEVQVRAQQGERPIEHLVQALEESASKSDQVRSQPQPRAIIESVSPNKVVIRLQFWHAPADLVTARAAVVMAAAATLSDAALPGIATSEPSPPSLALPEPL